jgi:thymidylate kinase
MVTVALIGADGAGKTTVARRLASSDELAVRYLYMGINSEASNHMLPTTRLARALKRALGRSGGEGGPPDPERARRRAQEKGLRRFLSELKSGLVLANLLGEEWYRSLLARHYERRGFVVLFDRHFYADYHAHDVSGEGRTLARRLHGKLLALLPRPDQVIVLDAPADVLFARKPEGTPELLERRRQEYLELRSQLGNCSVVDASQDQEQVVREVLAIIRRLRARQEDEQRGGRNAHDRNGGAAP